MKRNVMLLTAVALVVVSVTVTGCGTMTAAVNTTRPTRVEGYRKVQQVVVLPAVAEDVAAGDVMNEINSRTLSATLGPSAKIVGVAELQDFLGRDFRDLTRDPTNEALLKRIAGKFGTEAAIVCRVSGWEAAIKSGDAYRSRLALSYSLVDTKTFRTLSRISGDAYDVKMLPDPSYIRDLASRLARQLLQDL